MTAPDYSRYETIRIRAENGLHRLTLNRPEKMNAVNGRMTVELTDYFNKLHDDESARVVLLDAAGRNFCPGFDLSEIDAIVAGGDGPMSGFKLQRKFSDIVLRMRRCPQPIIALVHGAAAGAGLALALASDVRYAAEESRMNVAMAKVGLSGCDMGISYFLPRAVGASNAAEMMMGGRFVDAKKALRIGLVSEIAPREQLEDLGLTLAREMLAMSPAGLRITKEGLNAALDAGGLEPVIALEDRGQIMCIGAYMAEGARAFLEKRPPQYTTD